MKIALLFNWLMHMASLGLTTKLESCKVYEMEWLYLNMYGRIASH